MFKRSNNPGFSIGVDIESVARFQDLDPIRHKRFLERIFTLSELKYCFLKQDPAPHLAARFCAKEAVIKALGSRGVHKVSYNRIEIMSTKKDAPKVVLHIKGNATLQIQISISHTKDYAMACAIVFLGN